MVEDLALCTNALSSLRIVTSIEGKSNLDVIMAKFPEGQFDSLRLYSKQS